MIMGSKIMATCTFLYNLGVNSTAKPSIRGPSSKLSIVIDLDLI